MTTEKLLPADDMPEEIFVYKAKDSGQIYLLPGHQTGLPHAVKYTLAPASNAPVIAGTREAVIDAVEQEMAGYDMPEFEQSISLEGKNICALVDLSKKLMTENLELERACHDRQLEIYKLQRAPIVNAPVLGTGNTGVDEHCNKCGGKDKSCPYAHFKLNDAPVGEVGDWKPGTWYKAQTIDEMSAFYMSRLPAIREAAKECGYAIGLHGSTRRDFDLMAMAWREDAADKDTLAIVIQHAACGISYEKIPEKHWEKKPCGRMAVSLPICWTEWHDMASAGHIDLSVVETSGHLKDASVLASAAAYVIHAYALGANEFVPALLGLKKELKTYQESGE